MQFLVLLGVKTRLIRTETLSVELIGLEIQAVKQLLSSGVVRQAWRRLDSHAVALLVYAFNEQECRAILSNCLSAKPESSTFKHCARAAVFGGLSRSVAGFGTYSHFCCLASDAPAFPLRQMSSRLPALPFAGCLLQSSTDVDVLQPFQQIDWHWLWLSVAAFLAGVLNAVAGGGSFLLFPAMLGMKMLPVQANATNTVALWPGQLTSVAAYRDDIRKNRRLALPMGLAGLLGGSAGAVVLLNTPQLTFLHLVPWLLLVAALILPPPGQFPAGWRG